MRTLNKKVTSHLFTCRDGFKRLNIIATRLGKNGTHLTPAQFLIMNAVRGRDWTKSFTPPTNAVKLKNGGVKNWGLVHAIREIELALSSSSSLPSEAILHIFEGVVGRKELTMLASMLPETSDCVLSAIKGECPEPFVCKEDVVETLPCGDAVA